MYNSFTINHLSLISFSFIRHRVVFLQSCMARPLLQGVYTESDKPPVTNSGLATRDSTIVGLSIQLS